MRKQNPQPRVLHIRTCHKNLPIIQSPSAIRSQRSRHNRRICQQRRQITDKNDNGSGRYWHNISLTPWGYQKSTALTDRHQLLTNANKILQKLILL
jgi:hypothetical protein